ncbi:MAG: isovaleryl-CoA dehydrogenase [Candidatus Binatia bacterium]|nr:isovaleryl-CoA dehydrogenase [Candidatus Binatia bacterium]
MENFIIPSHKTHDVLNQPPPFEGHDLFATDGVLREALVREGASWAEDSVAELARTLTGEPLRWAVLANTYPPVLRNFDRYGHRIDEVEYHPAYHNLMELAVAHELHALPWRARRSGAHVARAAKFFLQSQVEAGHGCPISMTYSIVPALRHQPELAAEWEPKIVSREYDPRSLPARNKRGVICGMAMTEKQGGSDVRANTTRAEPVDSGGPGAAYWITGHKWFCSAPMSDAFLMLAYTEKGLSCFFVPRWRPDGVRNTILMQRLKDKLGNRSNASSEIELDRAWGRMVGEEGRGVRTIIEMVNHTRLDCVIGSAAAMRQALVQAIHHCRHRSAFGKRLTEQPLMQNVLADLALESEAATLTMMRLARAYDEADRNPAQKHFARIATAVAKYWVCKRTPMMVAEALECLGGAGYVEEAIMPRLYREAPLNGIWEGSGNVICLDVLRALSKEPETLPAFLEELYSARGEPIFDRTLERLQGELGDHDGIQYRARRLVEQMALLLQASLLLRHSPPTVALAFCRARLQGDSGRAFGTLPQDVQAEAIIERALPT